MIDLALNTKKTPFKTKRSNKNVAIKTIKNVLSLSEFFELLLQLTKDLK